jgi:polyphosphate kinase
MRAQTTKLVKPDPTADPMKNQAKRTASQKKEVPAKSATKMATKLAAKSAKEPDKGGSSTAPQKAVTRFLDRELSILDFNRRVLAIAADSAQPLLERLRYLCIVSSNLDEFFEVRVPDLYDQIRGQPASKQAVVVKQAIARISAETHELVRQQYALYNKSLIPALAKVGIEVTHHSDRSEAQRKWARQYFLDEVQPLLSPIALDPSHPFPQVVNKSLNFIVQLKGKDAFGRSDSVVIVKAPRVLPRVIAIPKQLCRKGVQQFVLLSSVIRANLDLVFSDREVVGFSQFRVTRDSDVWIDEGDVSNLRQALAQRLTTRAFGNAVRLEIAWTCPPELEALLLQQFGLQPEACYRVEGPVNLVRLQQLLEMIERADLRYVSHKPGVPRDLIKAAQRDQNLFEVIRARDVLLHHPFESFDPVIEFLRQAAVDPAVLAIKQTVYRTGINSVLMETLVDAARRGKEVTVVVELTARFDEAANINWAERLEAVGAQVVYGSVGLKTHAKACLVLRREHADVPSGKGKSNSGAPKIARYVHLSTGNYHPATARAYTDFGMFTANPEVCDDVASLFMHLTSIGKIHKLNHLWVAPFTLQKQLIRCIEREAQHAKANKPARIVAKVNALTDEVTVEALYAASQAGVQIELIVRGACILRPQVPRLSENIRVRSVLGRFLEHSRIFHFLNNHNDEVYLASADWMGRNLFRRIEIAWPVLDADIRRRVIEEGLKPYIDAHATAWYLNAEGDYVLQHAGKPAKAHADDRIDVMKSNPQSRLLELFEEQR